MALVKLDRALTPVPCLCLLFLFACTIVTTALHSYTSTDSRTHCWSGSGTRRTWLGVACVQIGLSRIALPLLTNSCLTVTSQYPLVSSLRQRSARLTRPPQPPLPSPASLSFSPVDRVFALPLSRAGQSGRVPHGYLLCCDTVLCVKHRVYRLQLQRAFVTPPCAC